MIELNLHFFGLKEEHFEVKKMEAGINMNETLNDIFNHAKNFTNANGTFERFYNNRKIDSPAKEITLVVYSILIVIGVFGNCFVVRAVCRKPSMRTARNMFILNLAVSDTLTCILGTTSTLMELLYTWPLPHWPSLCKATGAIQAISIFVSTISISAIALDRYQVVKETTISQKESIRPNVIRPEASSSVNPLRPGLKLCHIYISIPCIWIVAIAIASPLIISRTLDIHNKTIAICTEDWSYLNHPNGVVIYSSFLLVIHYILPALIIGILHFKTYKYLKTLQLLTYNRNSIKKITHILISIIITHVITWLPLNILNFLRDLDIYPEDVFNHDILFIICHSLSMTSSILNPMLYGWLNANFRNEFKEMYEWALNKIGLRDRNRDSDKINDTDMTKLTLLPPTGTVSTSQDNTSGT